MCSVIANITILQTAGWLSLHSRIFGVHCDRAVFIRSVIDIGKNIQSFSKF